MTRVPIYSREIPSLSSFERFRGGSGFYLVIQIVITPKEVGTELPHTSGVDSLPAEAGMFASSHGPHRLFRTGLRHFSCRGTRD